MTYSITTPKTTQPITPQSTARIAHKPSLDSQLKAALEHARRLTAMYGTDKIEVAIAWETVEELQVAKARQKDATQSAFARYCANNPEAPECRVYED
jgi:hypothetical protein